MKIAKWPMWAGLTALALFIVITVVLYKADRSHLHSVESTRIHAASSPPPSTDTQQIGCAFWSHCDLTAGASAAPATAAVDRTSRSVMAGQEPAEKIEFQIDAKGRIVMDEQARLNIEKLYALNELSERARKQRELVEGLPPAASRELTALIARYDTYQEEQLQRFPPGQELASVAEGLAHLNGLHELRVQRFGPEAAAGFFGAEEKIQRELLMQMHLDNDRSLTLEQKAEKVQASF